MTTNRCNRYETKTNTMMTNVHSLVFWKTWVMFKLIRTNYVIVQIHSNVCRWHTDLSWLRLRKQVQKVYTIVFCHTTLKENGVILGISVIQHIECRTLCIKVDSRDTWMFTLVHVLVHASSKCPADHLCSNFSTAASLALTYDIESDR